MGVSLFAPRRPLSSEGGVENPTADAPAKPSRGSVAGSPRARSASRAKIEPAPPSLDAPKAEAPRKERAPRSKLDARAAKGRLDATRPTPGASDAPKAGEGAVASAVHSYGREAAALLLLASALYVTLALASFRGDPMRVEVSGSDWVGPVGAVIAGALVQAAGACAWLVPLDLALFAAPLLQGKPAKVTLVRVSGDLVVLVVAAALLHVAFPASVAFGAMSIGGSAGELIGELMRALFSTLGSYIVGLTIVSLILIGRAAFSIIDWAQRAERRARALRERGEGGLRAIVGAWDQARELDEKRREEERRAGEPVITEACDEAIVAALGDDSPAPFPKVKPIVLGSGADRAPSLRAPAIGAGAASSAAKVGSLDAPRAPSIASAAVAGAAKIASADGTAGVAGAAAAAAAGIAGAAGIAAKIAGPDAPTPTPLPAQDPGKRGRKKAAPDAAEAAPPPAAPPIIVSRAHDLDAAPKTARAGAAVAQVEEEAAGAGLDLLSGDTPAPAAAPPSALAAAASRRTGDAPPATRGASALSRQGSAPAREASALAREASARAHEAPPGAHEGSAPVREASAPAREASALAREASAPAREASAPAREASALAREASAPAREASALAREAQAGSREAQAGSREAQAGSREAQAGAREAQAGSREAQAGAREAQAGSREAQAGSREAQAGSREAQAGSREAQAGSREAQAGSRAGAGEAALRIVDTSAALEAHKPAEIVKIVPAIGEGFRLPSTDLLEEAPGGRMMLDEEQLRQTAVQLEKVLADYGVSGKVEEIHPGPTVTTFEVSPAAGTKVSKVASLADDLALGLSRKVRIVAPIPGKNRIGFEVPNERRMPVVMRELVEDKRFLEMKAPLPCVLGRDIIGAPYFADLASMPHVIVAGATGAGKSVGLNVMLVSLLYRRTPAELKLLMIDPKVVELAPFDGIPHMLLPVVTDMKQASNALKWAVDEMERRYQLFANAGTRNITSYNGWVERVRRGEARPPKKALPRVLNAIAPDGTDVEIAPAGDGSDAELPEVLPWILIVVDEFADLMMQQGKDVEASVARLAQKARAAGMHVILATQRPSVDVITGMIKANFPTRIAFRVAQKVDSRTILDEQGAEHLLGRGDMLVKMNGSNDTRRVQCPFCSEEEVQRVTDFLRLQGAPVYDESILRPRDEDGEADSGGDDELDAMYDAAVRVVADTRRCSTSWLQRKLGIGYNRAAKIVEAMEKRGVVGPANGAKDREVLIGAI